MSVPNRSASLWSFSGTDCLAQPPRRDFNTKAKIEPWLKVYSRYLILPGDSYAVALGL